MSRWTSLGWNAGPVSARRASAQRLRTCNSNWTSPRATRASRPWQWHRISAGLLVIGHRRRSLICRMAEMSVAKRVMDHVHCPVMVAGSAAKTADGTAQRD